MVKIGSNFIPNVQFETEAKTAGSKVYFAPGTRTAEYKIFSRKFFEPVPRQIFVKTKI